MLHPRLAAAVGTTTRWEDSPLASHSLGRLNNGDIGDTTYYVSHATAPMAAYAVATDPSLVSLTESPITVSIPTPDVFPRYPAYYVSSFSVNCAYLAPGAPMETHDSRGPFGTWQINHPWAFFAYELSGVSSIQGNQFLASGAGLDNYIAVWIKSRRVIPYTTFEYGDGFGNFQTRAEWAGGGLCPALVYVLRPSTGAVVGWLGQYYMNGGYGPVSSTLNEIPQVLPGASFNLFSTQSIQNYAWVGDVSGIQDGDLIVWEWWLQGRKSVGGMEATYWGTPPFDLSIETALGGGVAGQPLTRVGASPDWAPSHGTPLNITGIQPANITSVRTTTISASLGAVSGSTGLTVVN